MVLSGKKQPARRVCLAGLLIATGNAVYNELNTASPSVDCNDLHLVVRSCRVDVAKGSRCFGEKVRGQLRKNKKNWEKQCANFGTKFILKK